MKNWLFSIGWVLFGLLGISALLISSDQGEKNLNPSTSSYGVTGASALADLLRLRGYDVVVDNHAKPQIREGDVVVAFEDGNAKTISDAGQVFDTEKYISEKVKAGSTVFWLPITPQINSEAVTAYKRTDGRDRSVSGQPTYTGGEIQEGAAQVLGDKQIAFIEAAKRGEGFEINYGNGIGLTNQYIDQADNAQVFVETLKAYAPQAKRVVFSEATFGHATDTGFLETLGPWAEGSWYQFLFFFLIVVITLNHRFGLPVRTRRNQVGGRELVDALADTMERGRATRMGLESAARRADLRLRSTVKLPSDASEGERERVLSPALTKSLAEVTAASTMERVRPSDALGLIVTLEKSLDEFVAANAISRSQSRKRR